MNFAASKAFRHLIWIWKCCGLAHHTELYEISVLLPLRLIYSGTEKVLPVRLVTDIEILTTHNASSSNVLKIVPRVVKGAKGKKKFLMLHVEVNHIKISQANDEVGTWSDMTWNYCSVRQYRIDINWGESWIVIAFPGRLFEWSPASSADNLINRLFHINQGFEWTNVEWQMKAICTDCEWGWRKGNISQRLVNEE